MAAKGLKMLKESNIKLRVLSEGEEARLLSHAFPYLQDIIVFAVNTGLRIGDVLSLQWTDVEEDIISKVMQKTERVVQVPLNDKAMAVVNGQRGIRKSRFVFYNPETGEDWKDLWPALKRARKLAGMEDINFHTFRHTFATRALRKSDLVTTKELCGHASIQTTLRYAHTDLDVKRKAVGIKAANDGVNFGVSAPGDKEAA